MSKYAKKPEEAVRQHNDSKYEVEPGCPDWGAPGERFCYECGEPVDELDRHCTGRYDDPLAAVLGTCFVCGAPNYEVLGNCPVCGGPVYEFEEYFGCYNTTNETCDFMVSIGRMEELGFFPYVINIKNLLDRGLEIHWGNNMEEPIVTPARIIETDGVWDVRIFDGPNPEDVAKLNNYDLGAPGRRRCPKCGKPVDDETLKSIEYDSSNTLATILGRCDVCYAREECEPIGNCPDCGNQVYELCDRFSCLNNITTGDCPFVISKDSIEEAVMTSNVMSSLWDAIIGDDCITESMISALECRDGLITWHCCNHDIYEYYKLKLEKTDKNGWQFKIVKDDPEMDAICDETRRHHEIE